MTREEAKTKPLHEVWEQFEILTLATKISDEARAKYFPQDVCQSADDTKIDNILSMLRGVLLERCKAYGPDGNGTPLPAMFIAEEMPLGVMIGAVDCKEMDESLPFYANAAQLKDISSMLAFWAWELEQRQKEAGL